MKHFYNEEAKRIDIMDERWYEVKDGDKTHTLRSVTTFLEVYPKGYGFRQWLKTAGFNADLVLERSAQFGSAVHSMIERALQGETVSYYDGMDIKVWERFLIWLDFWKELNANHDVKWSKDFVEMITYDLDLQYAGTVDLIARIDGEIELFDWKTGNYIGDEAEIQLSAYAKSVEKQLKCEVKKCNIVHIPLDKPNKKGYRIKEVTDIENNFEDFLSVQRVYFRSHKNEKPKYKTLPSEVNLETNN